MLPDTSAKAQGRPIKEKITQKLSFDPGSPVLCKYLPFSDPVQFSFCIGASGLGDGHFVFFFLAHFRSQPAPHQSVSTVLHLVCVTLSLFLKNGTCVVHLKEFNQSALTLYPNVFRRTQSRVDT